LQRKTYKDGGKAGCHQGCTEQASLAAVLNLGFSGWDGRWKEDNLETLREFTAQLTWKAWEDRAVVRLSKSILTNCQYSALEARLFSALACHE
jgi:hypothetical protein